MSIYISNTAVKIMAHCKGSKMVYACILNGVYINRLVHLYMLLLRGVTKKYKTPQSYIGYMATFHVVKAITYYCASIRHKLIPLIPRNSHNISEN